MHRHTKDRKMKITLTAEYPAYYGHEERPETETITAGDYRELINKLIDEDDKYHYGIHASTCPAAYFWHSPDSYDLDEDAVIPAKPDYTPELATSLARAVFNTSHIKIQVVPE